MPIELIAATICWALGLIVNEVMWWPLIKSEEGLIKGENK